MPTWSGCSGRWRQLFPMRSGRTGHRSSTPSAYRIRATVTWWQRHEQAVPTSSSLTTSPISRPAPCPAPLIRQSLDEFLLGSLDLYPGQVLGAVHAVARRTGRSGPAMTARDIAAYLQARGMPAFGKRLLADLDQPGRA